MVDTLHSGAGGVVELSRPERPRLSSIELGFPAVARLRALIGLSIVGAMLASLAAFMPWHVYAGEVHTGLDHGAAGTVIPAAWLVAFALMAWRRRSFGWMLGWAIIATIAATFCIAISTAGALDHLFENPESRFGESANFFGCVVAFFAALVGIAVVPIEFVRARRVVERRARARIPAARVRR